MRRCVRSIAEGGEGGKHHYQENTLLQNIRYQHENQNHDADDDDAGDEDDDNDNDDNSNNDDGRGWRTSLSGKPSIYEL